jgi:4a-hydroxytetrahydrobiopterin dehydratase
MTNVACDLSTGRCEPCEGGVAPLDKAEAGELLKQLATGWSLAEDTKAIHRRFEFRGFNETMGFVNAVAWIANQEMHHPDICLGYNYCEITFTTHAIDGLSRNDFICAAKIDRLLL